MTAPAAPRTQHHLVQFYNDDDRLCRIVAGFLADGIVAGDPALVIATGAHREGIASALSARPIDVERARRSGDLVLVDARETLDAVTAGRDIDPARFTEVVGGLVERMRADRPSAVLRAYGELVDLLWQAGRADAAVQVEMLWNKLAQTHRFTLLCGYSMGHFYKQVQRYEEIRGLHTRVLDDEETEEAQVFSRTPRR